MWLRLLLAPLLAPLLWSAARSLSWILIVLPILALYLETRVVHGSTPRVLPLSWPASSPVQPVESEDDAVSMLAHLIVRDFVKKWHNHIVQGCEDESAAAFPHAVTQSLRGILQRILLRLTQLDLSTWLMQRTLPLLREHVEKYRLAQTSLQGLTVTEEDPAFRDWFMATKYQHGELHPAVGHTSSLNTKETEHAHLRKRMDEFLHAFTKDTLCLGRVETALVREILACSVLYPLIDLVTSPDWIHLQIASKAERRLHELEQVGRVRESLSASSSETNSSRKPLHDFPASSPRRRWRSTSVRVRTNRSTPSKRSQTSKYERFLGRVENASSLLDVRRIRHELLNEIQRAKKELSRDPSNSRFEAYLCRLTSALDITEKRAAELGCLTEAPEQVSAFNDQCSLEQDQVSLGEILRNSSSLSYLLEFLNLCGRAVLVRFWIFVEAFKTPLEEVESDLGALDVQAMMKEVVPNPDADMCATTQSLKESMRPILDYCGSPLLQVRHQCKEVVETFLTLAPSLGVREHGLFIVRQCVLSMQADVLQIMLDQDWEPFTQSHLYAQAAEQVRQSQAFSEKTKKAASLEWDTESDDSLVEGLHPTHSKDERIPLRYGFLMGAGDGTKSDEPAPFRKPLFENDPLFEESESVTMAEKMWQPVFDKRNASLADEPPSDSLVTASSSMHLARTRHEVTTTRLKELHMRYEQLRQQKEKLDTFIKKAELTGASSQEQHVLQTARKAIERDARAADWEVTYLEQMLHQHGHLFDAKQATHVAIAIKDTEECKDQAGYTYNLYHIFVRVSMAVRGKPDVEYAWVVTRRYSAFRELHRSLRHQFRSIWACESLFPGKKLVGSTNAAFVESRRRSLERYLVAALELPDVRLSRAMQVFLSEFSDGRSKSEDETGMPLIERMLGSVSELADGIDELLDGFRPTMFDAVVQQILMAEGRLEAHSDASAEAMQGHFTEPLCDFLLELFQLKHKSDWLRRRAIVVVLQNLLGGTIESWIRQKMNHLLSKDRLHHALQHLAQILWPGGGPFQATPRPVRSAEEQRRTLEQARQGMSILVPDIADHIFGSERTHLGSQTMLQVIQNQRLNKHILYTLLDQFMEELLNHASS